MAAQDIYFPVYTKGPNGKFAYGFAKVTGVITAANVPEGAPMVNSRAMGKTPPPELQPDPS